MNPPILYLPKFVPNPDQAFASLRDELAWERRETTPRCEFYSNDFPHPYTYGAGRGVRTYHPQPFHPVMMAIRKLVEDVTGSVLEVSFLNMYSGGLPGVEDPSKMPSSDQLGWHADDSPEMDDTRPIGIISLGAEREIWFRQNPRLVPQQGEPYKLKLGHGSLCTMKPGMQRTWQHRIPKAGFVCGIRISITLRGYVPQILI